MSRGPGTRTLELREKYQVLPSMPAEQFDALKADIAERGVLTPIDVDEDGYILDGHHRYRACVELGVTDFPTIVRPGMSEEERRMFARKSNMLRRHLTREQVRQLIAEQLKDTPNWADNRIGQALGADAKTVRTVREQLEATSEIPKLDRLVGADGKERPRKRPPAVMASNVDELERILKRIRKAIDEGRDPSELEGFTTERGVVFLGVMKTAFDYFTDEQRAQWAMYGEFMAERLGWPMDAVADHVEWITRRDFKTPAEWLGEPGARYRRNVGLRDYGPGQKDKWLKAWNAHLAKLTAESA